MVSNYPPGHPTGVSVAEAKFGFVHCEHCLIVEERKREVEPLPKCACGRFMEVLLCDRCEEEAEIEVYERDVNAAAYYCQEHAR